MQISAGSPVLDLGGPSQIGISRVTNDVLRPRSRARGTRPTPVAGKRQPRARAHFGLARGASPRPPLVRRARAKPALGNRSGGDSSAQRLIATSSPTYERRSGTTSPGKPRTLSREIEADDRAGTITIRLTAPDADFLSKLAHVEAPLVPPRTPLHLGRRHALAGGIPDRVVRGVAPTSGFSAGRGAHR